MIEKININEIFKDSNHKDEKKVGEQAKPKNIKSDFPFTELITGKDDPEKIEIDSKKFKEEEILSDSPFLDKFL